MIAAEFQANITDGTIQIPLSHRDRFQGDVCVILLADAHVSGDDPWPEQNARRWQLISQATRRRLSQPEQGELDSLNRLADQRLDQVGPRPIAELEKLYAELNGEESARAGSA